MLYEDATQRIENDPFFIPVLEKEGGGSYGMWPQYLHIFHGERPEVSVAFTEYLDLVEALLSRLG